MIRNPLAKMADDGWLPEIFKKKTNDGYPYYCYLLVYIIALIPILTGMNVDNAISMLMIPTMVINVYLNIKCIYIPRNYPEQFENRGFRIPKPLFIISSILGGICAAIIAITLFKDLNLNNAIIAACVVIVPMIFSYIALKTNSVNKNKLENQKKLIVEQALANK